jgi:pimeloyl-ACP methyl ester carboxylesterase
VLAIQGADDEFGTLQQIRAIEAGCAGPVQTLVLPACGHSPHRDQGAATLQAMTESIRRQALDSTASAGSFPDPA